MTQPLLNENQRRRLSTNLLLLETDLTTLGGLPELTQAGQPYEQLRDLLATIRGKASATREAFDLGNSYQPSLKRRVAAIAEIWGVRVEDLVARRLQGYGSVHPDLAAKLDPRVMELAKLLEQLADTAAALPDS